ncbi:unnamed protein product [Durusdinium trenchii]|uniref:Uncharacterized protein n=1 Tax=Durusdinium trenchii TaxID=1381693 RepID=A0ABP0LA21_9DINO
MPVYEEKLISPLAVRFSQDRVRTTFRNGQSLEEVIELVKVKEVGDKSSAEPFHPYDVILQPPFSNIEVVRWGPRKLRVNGSCGISLPGDEMHWYTNCNQRLYVLQRVAAKYWPKKVACEVDVLFTVPNELLKTYDSSTAGLLAALSESAHCESASVWNWGRAVTNSNGKMDMALERAAMKQLEKDDASCTLADLVSIPHVLKTESRAEVLDDAETFAASTSSEQVMASPRIQSSSSEKQEEAEVENKPKCEAEKGSKKKKAKSKQKERKSASGKKESAKRADSWSSKWPSFAEHWEGVSGLLEGQWRGPKGETYQMSFEEPSDDDVTGCCTRDSGRDRDRMSQRTFSICYEYDTCLLWWGLQRKFCLDPEEVRSNPHCARWYVVGKDTPEFEWKRIEDSEPAKGRQNASRNGARKSDRRRVGRNQKLASRE